eukprot:m.712494 g.712494  ORF g.712494 m.712494 type:complete len:143 (+) comp22961_c0_seq7:1978-2406(+)
MVQSRDASAHVLTPTTAHGRLNCVAIDMVNAPGQSLRPSSRSTHVQHTPTPTPKHKYMHHLTLTKQSRVAYPHRNDAFGRMNADMKHMQSKELKKQITASDCAEECDAGNMSVSEKRKISDDNKQHVLAFRHKQTRKHKTTE